MSARRRARRAREKSDWASDSGKPLLTRGGASPAGAHGVAVERVVQRSHEREDPVEAGDASIFLATQNIQQLPFGGTSILITVGVTLETMKQIESQLMMRHYEGFLK